MKSPITVKTPVTPPPIPAAAGSVIGPDLIFKGDFSGGGDLTVMGRVDGAISVGQVTVRELAHVDGAVRGGQVDIRGHVEGEIHGKTLRIFNGAEVEGTFTYETLYLEAGSSVNGDFRSVAPALQAPIDIDSAKATS